MTSIDEVITQACKSPFIIYNSRYSSDIDSTRVQKRPLTGLHHTQCIINNWVTRHLSSLWDVTLQVQYVCWDYN